MGESLVDDRLGGEAGGKDEKADSVPQE